MFIGHYALALAAKKATPKTSLATLIFAAAWCDLLWPILLWLGWERVSIHIGTTAFNPLVFESYPWSHSLMLVAAWATLIGGLHWLARKDRQAALIIGMLVLSHWLLDWISHRPDMPLWPGGALHGLELWNHVGATVFVESALFVAGVTILPAHDARPFMEGACVAMVFPAADDVHVRRRCQWQCAAAQHSGAESFCVPRVAVALVGNLDRTHQDLGLIQTRHPSTAQLKGLAAVHWPGR